SLADQGYAFPAGLCLWGIGPVEDVLDGGKAAGSPREANVSRSAAHRLHDVDGVRLGCRGLCHGVRNAHRQRRAVVVHRDVERVAAVQIDSGRGQVDRADIGRRGTVDVKTGGIGAFALIVVQVELDGYALAYTGATKAAVTQASSYGSQRGRVDPLQGKREAVC